MQLPHDWMDLLHRNHCNKMVKKFSQQNGLTLIEVLIALAIVSIALTAIIKATSHTVQSTGYLKNKQTALWIGESVIKQVQSKQLKLELSARTEEHLTTFKQDWYWRAELKETPNAHIKKIIVDVYDQSPDNDTPSLNHLESYLYEA